MSKKNVFTPNLVELLDSLTDLAYAATLQELVTKRAIRADSKEPKRTDLKLRDKIGAYFYGTTLPVNEYFRSTNWENLMVTSQYVRQDATEDDAHELAREVEGRIQAQIVCAVFEVMEVYLRRIGAKLLFQNRSGGARIPIHFDRQKIERLMSAEVKKKAGTLQYFEEYMRRKYRGGYTPFLKELHVKLPSVKAHVKYDRALTMLIGFYRGVEFIRHHTVHCNGRYDERALRKLGKSQQDAIRSITRRSRLFKADMILPSREGCRT